MNEMMAEPPLPMASWDENDGADPLRSLESDVAGLLRRNAELTLALSESKQDHEKKLEKMLLEIVDVIDGFERVFRAVHGKPDLVTPQMKIWLGNFRTVRRLVDNILDENGVAAIRNLEGGFDPQWHRAVETVRDAARADGTIVEELRPGYLRGKDILRKSEVVVVRNAD